MEFTFCGESSRGPERLRSDTGLNMHRRTASLVIYLLRWLFDNVFMGTGRPVGSGQGSSVLLNLSLAHTHKFKASKIQTNIKIVLCVRSSELHYFPALFA